MPLPPSVGQALASQLAELRGGASTILYKGKSYPCIVRSYEERAVPGFVPQGPGRNAGNKDGYEFSVTPTDFPQGLPLDTEEFAWQGMTYTLARHVPMELAGTLISVRYVGYAKPVTNPSSQDAQQGGAWPAPPTQ